MAIATAGLRPNAAVDWPRVYLGVSALGLGGVVLKWSNVPPFGDVSGLTLATVIVGVFAITSLFHWRDTVRRDSANGNGTRRA